MKRSARVFTGLLSLALLVPFNCARSSEFYKGKTITFIHASSPGGSHDTHAKVVKEYLRRYIPGQPTLVSQYMDGAGGLKAANSIFAMTRPDGLTVGTIGSMVRGYIFGATGIKFDPAKFVYLGAADTDSGYRVLAVRKELGLETVEKLQAASGLRWVSQSVGHDTYIPARFFTHLLDLKDPKFITGYSGPEMEVAFANGEVDARAINVILLGRERYRPLIDAGKAAFVATIGRPERHEERVDLVASLPNLREFARTDKEKRLLEIYRRVSGAPRWVYFSPPGTPVEATKILRNALRKVFEDGEFFQAYEKAMALRPLPQTGEMVEKATSELLEQARDPEIIKLLRRIVGPEALPSR